MNQVAPNECSTLLKAQKLKGKPAKTKKYQKQTLRKVKYAKFKILEDKHAESQICQKANSQSYTNVINKTYYTNNIGIIPNNTVHTKKHKRIMP